MPFSKSLKQTVEDYGLVAHKALGQNFLLDQNITDKIIKLSLEKQLLKDFTDKNVLEIGPGPGGLTRAILQKNPKTLTVVEMDERCVNIISDLSQEIHFPIKIINQDALLYNISQSNTKLQIISNLPYNISVPLLTKWLQNLELIESMTLMFQKEVADRILASTRTKEYGRLSILAQLTCHTQKLITLEPSCFVPAPKIQSTVLLFQPFKQKVSQDLLKMIEKLTMLAFSQRRKMIRQSLKQIANLEQICEKISIPLTARAEEIEPEQYLQMAQMLI